MSNEYQKGAYRVRVDQQTFTENKKGNPQLVLDISVLGKVEPDGKVTPVPVGHRIIFLSLAAPKPGSKASAIQISHEKLRSAFPEWGGDLASLDPDAPNHYSFVGKETTAFNHGKRTPTDKYDDWDLPNSMKPKERKNSSSAAQKASAILKAIGVPTTPQASEQSQTYDEVPF